MNLNKNLRNNSNIIMKSAVKECKEPIAVVSIDTGTIDEEIRVYEGDDV